MTVKNLSVCGTTDAKSIADYCERNKFTENAFWNGVFSYVLSRFCFKEDAVYTTIYSGRSDSRLVNTVTMLAKPIPVITYINGSDKITDYILSIREQLVSNMANEIYSFYQGRWYNKRRREKFIKTIIEKVKFWK